jgi:hypothetical protein
MKQEMSLYFPAQTYWTPSQSYGYDFFLSFVSTIIMTCWRSSHGNDEVAHLYLEWPAQLEEDQCLLTHDLRSHSFHNMPVQTSSCWHYSFHIVACMPLIRRVLVQMIGFIYQVVTHSLLITLIHRLYNAVSHLHQLKFTVAHSLGFSVHTSRFPATDVDAQL